MKKQDFLTMEIRLFEASNGPCPYLDDLEWVCYLFQANHLDGAFYEMLINKGFRRNGKFFYKNNCHNCKACVSIRVIVDQFKPSRSQKRVWRKNRDIWVTQSVASYEEEDYALYQKYTMDRHNTLTTREEYRQFLINSAVDTIMMRYYFESKLIGIGWVDILPRSLSSVYYAFDPDYSDRSLGVFSVMKEVELCRELDKEHLHLGFWVKNNNAMKYKSQYNPHQLLIDNEWSNVN